jgi:alpha-2-macroglobulin
MKKNDSSIVKCIFVISILLVLSTVLYAQQKPYDYKSADLQQVKNSSSQVMIMPESYLREYDPLTIMYSGDMNPSGAGPLDKPEQYLSLKPSHPGEYRWLDPRTIEFRPAVPWQPMQNYTVKVQGVSKTLTVLLMPPISVFPSSGSAELDPVSRVMLEFSEPVDPQVLAKLLTFETNQLPGIERSNPRIYGSSEFTIKKSEKSSKNSNQYWVVFKKPFANGLRVRTVLKLASDPLLSDARRTYYFDTRKEFTIAKAGTWNYQFTVNPSGSVYGKEQALRLSSDGVILLEFTVPPVSLSLSQVKSLVNFSPSPKKMDWSLDGNRLVIRLTPEKEKLYNVVITPVPIVDKDGRKLLLNNRCSFYCYQPADQQYIRWGLASALVERFGPKHFPLLVNGVKSIDLRVYKIDPFHKAFWPYPFSPVDFNETAVPPGPGEEPVKDEQILSPLNPGEIGNHIKMLGSPHYSEVIDLDKEGVTRFQSIDFGPVFDKIAGNNKPGTYLAGFRTLDGSSTRSFVRIQVSDLCLSTVESKTHINFVVTSYSSGKPVSNAEILIEGASNEHFTVITKGTTGSDGSYLMEHTQDLKKIFELYSIKRITVKNNDDILVLDTRNNVLPPSFTNNHWNGGSSWLEWLANDRYDLRKDRREKGFVFSERPIYRPNETIYLKGYVRSLYQGRIENSDPADAYIINVISPSGAKYTYPVKLSSWYSFNDSVTEKDLPTGEYQVELTSIQKNSGEMSIAQTSFAVEAYRIPKFEVRLTGPDKVPNDRSVNISLAASYYAGGKVFKQNVAWRVVAYPYSYSPESATGYLLSTDNRYGAVNEDNQNGVIEKTDETNENGISTMTVNVQSATNGNPKKYVCEATVTDEDEQTVSDRHTFIALPPFALGMKVNRHITGTKTIRADIIALGIKGNFEAKHKVNIQLKKVSWTSFLQETDFSRGKPKYMTQETVAPIAEKTIETAAKPVNVEFNDNEPGVYILEISARDKLGRVQSVKADLFVAGNKGVTWKKSDKLIFETVPDQQNYEPGQNAKILLKSPYQRGAALAVIEKPDGVPEYKWVDVSDGQGTFTLAITKDMAPVIPVSFLLMRPRISTEKRIPDGSYVDAGIPQTVANTTWINVVQIDNILKVAIDHPAMVRPGSKIDMTVYLKDGRGKPTDGEVAFWLVDEAVLALATEKQLNPLPSFTPSVNSHINIRDSRNLVYGDLRIQEAPGGDGDEGEGDMFGKVTVRKNFKTVPYWNPSLVVDKSGQAVVSFTMSDDLTNFAVRAVAVAGSDKFGTGKSQVKVRLPLIIQPALPRFVRPGDKINAGGIVRVIEGSGGSAKYQSEIKGLRYTGGEMNGDCKLDNVKPYSIKAGMIVNDLQYDTLGNPLSDSVYFKMAVIRESDKASDAFSVALPLKPDRFAVEESMFADLQQGKTVTIPGIKEKPRPGTLNRQLLISDQMAILKAVAGMHYLVKYPHGCTEQQISKVYPGVVYRDIWAKYGLDAPDKNYKRTIGSTLEYLQRAQNQEGFFGYWPGCSGYTYLTAYVIDFLTEVKRANASGANYPFDDEMYKKGIEALKRSLRTDYSGFVDGYKYYERSVALLSLANAGQLDMGYARELAVQSNDVDVQSQSRVLRALYKNSNAFGTEIKDLNKRLWDQTVFKLDGGKEVFAGLQQRSFRIGARVHSGEITSLASMIHAFSNAPERPSKLPFLVQELVTLGSDGGWGSTQANGIALLALRDYIAQPEGKGKTTVKLKGDKNQEEIVYNAKNGALTKAMQNTDKTELSIVSSTDKNPLFLRYSHHYIPEEPGYKTPASQKGFVIRREMIILAADGKQERMWLDSSNMNITVSAGDIIEEHIQVQNPKNCNFVAVSAPFAAGLEYMNPRLETSGEDARPSGTTTNEGTYQAYMDDQAVFYFENMNAGTYDFYFRVKATVQGEFTHPSARAEMMYEMSTYGCSPGAKVIVR